MEVPKLKFDQDLCGTCDMNATLGSVVPLAMFRHFDNTYNTLINEVLLGSFRTIIYAALVGEKRGRVSQKKVALLGKVHLNIHKRAKHCFRVFSPQLLLQKYCGNI